jgi:hypothetical protein
MEAPAEMLRLLVVVLVCYAAFVVTLDFTSKLKRKNRKRSLWMRAIFRKRKEVGAHSILPPKLLSDEGLNDSRGGSMRQTAMNLLNNTLLEYYPYWLVVSILMINLFPDKQLNLLCMEQKQVFNFCSIFIHCLGCKTLSQRAARRLIVLHPKHNIVSQLRWHECLLLCMKMHKNATA